MIRLEPPLARMAAVRFGVLRVILIDKERRTMRCLTASFWVSSAQLGRPFRLAG